LRICRQIAANFAQIFDLGSMLLLATSHAREWRRSALARRHARMPGGPCSATTEALVLFVMREGALESRH